MESRNSASGKQFFNPDELHIATIGTGYFANTLSGTGVTKVGATLTNKRLYFSGSVYSRNANGHFVSSRQRKVVNTRDITGTGYDFYRPLYLILFGFISLFVSVIFSIVESYGSDTTLVTLGFTVLTVCIILYLLKRRTLLTIEYAGGNIAFDVKWIQKHEQDDFIRNIHLAKDNLFSSSTSTRNIITTDNDEIPFL